MQNWEAPLDTRRENLGDLGFGDDFLDMLPKAQSMKEKIEKLDFISIKHICSVKDLVKKMKRKATGWQKIL